MSHTLVDDVQNYIDEVDNNLQSALSDSVDCLIDNITNAQSALESVESELRYVNDELEEKEDTLLGYEDIGDLDECQAYKDDLEVYEALGTESEVTEAMAAWSRSGESSEALTAALESVANKQAAIDLLQVINKSQANRIKAARLALLTDEDTGLTQSQQDYMEYLRDGEPQDVVLARGVELKVDDLLDNEQPTCLCPPAFDLNPVSEGTVDDENALRGPIGGPIVGWDANGSPVMDDE